MIIFAQFVRAHGLVLINHLNVSAKSKFYWYRGGIKKVDEISMGKNMEKICSPLLTTGSN
jgi:hypothetical protein